MSRESQFQPKNTTAESNTQPENDGIPEGAIGVMALLAELGISYVTLKKRMDKIGINDNDYIFVGKKRYLSKEAADRIRAAMPKAEQIDPETYLSAREAAQLIGCNHITLQALLRECEAKPGEVRTGKSTQGQAGKRYHVEYVKRLRAEYEKRNSYLSLTAAAKLIGCDTDTLRRIIAENQENRPDDILILDENTKKYSPNYVKRLQAEYEKRTNYSDRPVRGANPDTEAARAKELKAKQRAAAEAAAARNPNTPPPPPEVPFTEDEKTRLIQQIEKMIHDLSILLNPTNRSLSPNDKTYVQQALAQLEQAKNEAQRNKRPKNIYRFLDDLQKDWIDKD